MRVTRTVEETREAAARLAREGSLALVPTMGALHAGHRSLLARGRQVADRIAVSIFVNPTQFAPGEDFERYPRPIDRDIAWCEEHGADLVFHPTAEAIYPPGEPETIVDVPDLTAILEGAHRPGFFIGVCRVVAKLLGIVQPHVACFGMKDYQQLLVIEAMTAGLCLPVRIERCPTVREADGLAASSRNAYLTPAQRRRAVGLHKALEEARRLIADGQIDPQQVESAMAQVMRAHRFEADYAAVRHARTLAELDVVNPSLEPIVCLLAGRLGDVRLIDNTVIEA